MSYRFSRHRIHEIVNASKVLTTGQSVEPENYGGNGLKFHAYVELADGPFLDIRYLGKATQRTQPNSYDATLILDAERIRGVGFNPVKRENFRAKQRIPAGWHQNICDPNMPTTHPESNRHEPLADFHPTDFRDFTRKVAKMWNIDLNWESDLM